MSALAPERRLTGRTVLLLLLGFFGVVAAANAVFITLAVRTFTGLAVESPYQRGLAYNEELAAAAAQRARGWRTTLQFEPRQDGEAALAVAIRDAAGAPVVDLDVQAELRRPASQGHDVAAQLAPRADGSYGATLRLPLRGQWDLRLVATDGRGARHVVEERLWLP